MRWVADVLVVAGVLGVTLAVVGMARLPGVLQRLHASTLGLVLGVVLLLLSTVGTGDGALVVRALLVAGCLLLTGPVSSHAIAWLDVEPPQGSPNENEARKPSDTWPRGE